MSGPITQRRKCARFSDSEREADKLSRSVVLCLVVCQMHAT